MVLPRNSNFKKFKISKSQISRYLSLKKRQREKEKENTALQNEKLF